MTRCRNDTCPFKIDGSCNHDIWEDGPTCDGNKIGFRHRSQIQDILMTHEQECERKGVEPMPRNIYLEI